MSAPRGTCGSLQLVCAIPVQTFRELRSAAGPELAIEEFKALTKSSEKESFSSTAIRTKWCHNILLYEWVSTTRFPPLFLSSLPRSLVLPLSVILCPLVQHNRDLTAPTRTSCGQVLHPQSPPETTTAKKTPKPSQTWQQSMVLLPQQMGQRTARLRPQAQLGSPSSEKKTS